VTHLKPTKNLDTMPQLHQNLQRITTQLQCCQPQNLKIIKREHKIFKILPHLAKPFLFTYKAFQAQWKISK
jgi:cytochrome c-type biogenesis protein CcmH/NrfF